MARRTFVVGVGMTKFDKQGTKEGGYADWAQEAVVVVTLYQPVSR